jgi:hypothetical protein
MGGILQSAALDPSLIETFFTIWKTKGERYVTMLKKQQTCVEHGLKDFNWVLNMPLDYS